MTVTFACGHKAALMAKDTGSVPPTCGTCGERRVRHTDVRPPNFRGVAQGPSARTEALSALPMALAPSLPLKEIR